MSKVRKNSKKLVYLSLLGAAVVLLAGFWLWHSHHPAKHVSTIPSSSPNSANKTADSSNAPSQPGGTAASSNKSAASSDANSSASLLSPTGNFVSNHHPSLSDPNAPSQEQSSCVTTPGANCYIEFSKSDGTLKRLDTKVADSNGNVIWSWDVRTAGFSTGSYSIKAVATLGGQTKSTSDSMALEVKP